MTLNKLLFPFCCFMAIFYALNVEALLFCREDNWIQLGSSYRQDCFSWDIAGPYKEPNVLSELKWKDLESIQATIAAKCTIPTGVYGRLLGSYGNIFEGHVIDADYAGSHRTHLFSYSRSKANKGRLWDLSVGVGYPILSCFGHFKISPIAGYSRHEQHLHIRGGTLWVDQELLNALLAEDVPPTSSSSFEHSDTNSGSANNNSTTTAAPSTTTSISASSSLLSKASGSSNQLFDMSTVNSTYKAKWSGPWVGIDWDVTFLRVVDFFGGVEFHWTSYRAKGHWDQRKDLADDFKHKSHGMGFVINGGLRWNFSSHWSLAILGGYQHWHAFKGTDKTYYFSEKEANGSFGGPIHTAKLRLNRVKWHSFNTGLGLVYRF